MHMEADAHNCGSVLPKWCASNGGWVTLPLHPALQRPISPIFINDSIVSHVLGMESSGEKNVFPCFLSIYLHFCNFLPILCSVFCVKMFSAAFVRCDLWLENEKFNWVLHHLVASTHGGWTLCHCGWTVLLARLPARFGGLCRTNYNCSPTCKLCQPIAPLFECSNQAKMMLLPCPWLACNW